MALTQPQDESTTHVVL